MTACEYGSIAMSDPYGAMLIDAVAGLAFEQEIIERDDGFFDTSTIDYYLAPFAGGMPLSGGRSATPVAACWTLAAARDEWRWNFKHAVERWLRSILRPERWRSPVGVAFETFASCGSKMWTRPSGASGPC